MALKNKSPLERAGFGVMYFSTTVNSNYRQADRHMNEEQTRPHRR